VVVIDRLPDCVGVTNTCCGIGWRIKPCTFQEFRNVKEKTRIPADIKHLIVGTVE